MNENEQRKLGLRLFKGEKYKALRAAIREGKCFDELLPLAEEAGAVEHWDMFIEEWIYWAGLCLPGVTNEMRITAFLKLTENEWIYRAGLCFSGITDKMRREAFLKFKENEWIYRAGLCWHGISDDMIKIKERQNEF